MTNETKRRISAYRHALPGMREKVGAAMVMLLIAVITTVTATYAWITISRAPEVRNITTTLAANGSLEIALSKEDGSQPEEFDIDESVTGSRDVVVTNLQWGNLVNLSDDSYGIENLALRPARLNTASLLTSPLWGAVYGSDGRVTNLDSNYAYVKYDGTNFLTSNNTYGVRAIASYTATIADSTQQAYNEKVQAVMSAHQKVNEAYSVVPGKFSPLGTMISKYAQDKLDNANPGTNLAPYLPQVIDCFQAVYDAMLTQKDAYVALANFQSYMNAQNTGTTFTEVTWDQLVQNKAAYNAANTSSTSTNKIISLVGLTQFITDLGTMESDLNYLNLYYQDNGVPYYWGQKGENTAYPSGPNLNVFISHLIDHNSMTIDLEDNGTERAVTSLSASDASALLGANGKTRKAYIYNGIIKRFEQSAVDESYRLNGNAACTIKVTYVLTITVYGKAYTKASGPCDFMTNYSAAVAGSNLVANDCVADDTYGLVIDLWTRTNAEQTCLTLEGATTTNEDGTIVSYDGINRVWGSTGEAVLTTDSTTQGGGSCYIYYADTPEDMMRSLSLLDAMKVAFVDESGNLMARASMDTVNYYAVNGRITVPLVLDSDTQTTYEYTNDLNEVLVGRAITTMYTDNPIRISTIVYLDGDMLTNDDVLAAAEIQGQLNLQFGSSTNLKTVGSNELIDDTRSVTATVSKNSMDYDTAVVAADLTTEVTLNVQGTDPREVTAFFVRAINSTQGSREPAMTFTKQADGTWTSSYKFTAPGTYYLRYVRLDGVDYALAEPQKVEVSGFTLESLTWGEPGSSAVIRTSANTYSETVSVKFAASDRSKLPTSVQARFVRTDGNTVNIPLTYSSSTNQWTGTGTFSTSGVYTLEYLVFDNKYKDLTSLGWDKTLDLSLGMYVTVYQNGGALTEQYVSGKTYSKDVWVKIFDNTGKEMEALEGAILYYSNGGSASGTINTNLTWNEEIGYYDGTLPIVNAGRYRFSSVMLEGNYLTKCTDSPVYTVISPDPPIYDTASACTYYGDNIQFVPLTNDAVIDNIKIANAESATVTAVVYNDNSGKYYTLDSESGKVIFTGNAWNIKLPTYTLNLDADGNPVEGAVYTQEGTWSLVCLNLTDCYDASSNYRDSTHPIIWAGNDSISNAYLGGSNLTADQKFDFSKLSTKVSCSLNVSMVPGTTTLGSGTAEFMSRYPVSDLGMYVLLTDDAGNIIPSSKVGDVTLNVKYTPNSTSNAYGYKVQSGAAADYAIKLNAQDAEDGHRTVSAVNGASDFDWQYVGVYSVQNLQVSLGGTTKTYTVSDNIGLASAYTITTAGPSAENIALLDSDIAQRNTTIGKTGDNITGTFLQSGDPGVTAKITLTTSDNSNTQYVILDDVSMQLVLTHQGGSSANGGYTFTPGTSQYESITMNLTNTGGTYVSSSTPLLAGTYKAQLKATVGSITTTKDLKNVAVYSKQPTLKINSINPDEGKTVQINTYTGEKPYLYGNVQLVDVQNYKSDDLANVYIAASKVVDSKSGWELVDYTLPNVSLTLSDAGSFNTATAVLSNAGGTFKFASNKLTSDPVDIGSTSPHDFVYAETWGGNKTSTYHSASAIGEQTISAITLTREEVINGVKTNVDYNVSLTKTITIRENNVAPPSITFASPSSLGYEGYDDPSVYNKTSSDGGSFTIELPKTLGTTQKNYEVTDNTVQWVKNEKESVTQYIMYCEIGGSEAKRQTDFSLGVHTWCHYDVQQTFTYKVYTRTTYAEDKISTSQTYLGTYGLVKWKIGDQEYNPGDSVTVTGSFRAIPVIERIGEGTAIGNPVTKHLRRYYRTESGPEDKTCTTTYSGAQYSVWGTSSDNNTVKNQSINEAKATYINADVMSKAGVSGYDWFSDKLSYEAWNMDAYEEVEVED